MSNTVISYPIPLYANVPINAQYYQPSVLQISAITLGLDTLVTTTINHNYVLGQEVRLNIPYGYGSTQLDQQTGYVISIPELNQVLVNINSLNSSAFINATLRTKPQITAIGDINSGYVNPNGRTSLTTSIPGSFINISPQ